MSSVEIGSARFILLDNGLDDLAAVRDFCQQIVSAAFDGDRAEEVTGSLQLAATEAVVNVVKHGYAGASEKPIECRERIDASNLSLDILHRGVPFEPVSIPKIEEPQENGMGLFLMLQCVDEVTYSESEDGRQCITLTIHLELPNVA